MIRSTLLTLLAVAALQGATNDATVPVPRDDYPRFATTHAEYVHRAVQGNVDLLFLGDSITEHWKDRAQTEFDKAFGAWKTANFGIGGDKVQNILWRVENGTLEGIKPKVVVLLAGTNNTSGHTAANIAEGTKALIAAIQQRVPGVKVLLLGVLPRGPRKTSSGGWDDAVKSSAVIQELNPLLAALADGTTVRYAYLGDLFLKDGKVDPELMPDALHPSKAGYVKFAEALKPIVTEMMR